MKKLVLLGALALSVLSMQAFAEGKPLKIGIEAAYPPFASKAPDGERSSVLTTTSATPCVSRCRSSAPGSSRNSTA